MRATAQDPDAARLMGINVDTTIAMTFLIGGMLAGAAGLIYALYQTTIWYFQGFQAGLIAFTAAVMGGIGNLKGAVLGGFIIGMIQQICDNRESLVDLPVRPLLDAGVRLRLPRAHHGLQAVRPARRGDEGGRMSVAAPTPPPEALVVPGAAAREGNFFARNQNMLLTALFLTIAALLPFFLSEGGNVMNNLVLGAAYTVMALGLNIIVGYAGLLDLGYVAFFAIGAYTVGYFGSGFWDKAGGGEGLHFLVGEPASNLPGIHLNFFADPDHRDRGDDGGGHDHRPADAAPARRLHRDRDARVRRDHRPHRDQRRRRPGSRRRSPPAARASRRSTRSTSRSSTGSPR